MSASVIASALLAAVNLSISKPSEYHFVTIPDEMANSFTGVGLKENGEGERPLRYEDAAFLAEACAERRYILDKTFSGGVSNATKKIRLDDALNQPLAYGTVYQPDVFFKVASAAPNIAFVGLDMSIPDDKKLAVVERAQTVWPNVICGYLGTSNIYVTASSLTSLLENGAGTNKTLTTELLTAQYDDLQMLDTVAKTSVTIPSAVLISKVSVSDDWKWKSDEDGNINWEKTRGFGVETNVASGYVFSPYIYTDMRVHKTSSTVFAVTNETPDLSRPNYTKKVWREVSAKDWDESSVTKKWKSVGSGIGAEKAKFDLGISPLGSRRIVSGWLVMGGHIEASCSFSEADGTLQDEGYSEQKDFYVCIPVDDFAVSDGTVKAVMNASSLGMDNPAEFEKEIVNGLWPSGNRSYYYDATSLLGSTATPLNYYTEDWMNEHVATSAEDDSNFESPTSRGTETSGYFTSNIAFYDVAFVLKIDFNARVSDGE